MMASLMSRYDLAAVESLLETIRTSSLFIAIVEGTQVTPVWEATPNPYIPKVPETTELVKALGLPKLPRSLEPPMILHNLGSFVYDTVLKSRIEGVFSGKNVFLFNASATGKTRITYEGLCRNWGFYFTSATDTARLGDPDLESIIGRIREDDQFTRLISPESDSGELLARNFALAHRYFSAILLARLLVFKLFLEAAVAHGLRHKHKSIWLRLQLGLWSKSPIIIDFCKLALELVDALPDKHDFDLAISETLSDIMAVQDITAESPVFIVLDEANAALKRLDQAFLDGDGNYYPELKVILRTWSTHLNHPRFAFVVAGTEIPFKYFTEDEWSGWVWTSDTGAFDNREEQRRYALSFLPSSFASSPSGQLLLDRIWKWTRGRYRITASLLSVFLEELFISPHQQLHSYISTLSGGYCPPGRNWGPDLCHRTPFSSVPFESLDSNRRLSLCMHQTVLSYLLQTGERNYFSVDDIVLVNKGFGRFVDTGCSLITIDEPFILAGAARWFRNLEHFLIMLDYFIEKIFEPTISSQHALGYVTLCLAATFDHRQDGRRIDEVFEFSKETKERIRYLYGCIVTPGRSRKKKARDTALMYSENPSAKIVHWSRSAQTTLSWIKDRSTPFCIHLVEDEAMLIFVIKTSKGERFWVFLRVLRPTDEEELAAKARALADSYHPRNVFQDSSPSDTEKALETLPNLSSLVGEMGVLRVLVSFTQTVDPSELGSDEASTVVTLNLKLIASCTEAYGLDMGVARAIGDAIMMNVVSSSGTPPEREWEAGGEDTEASSEDMEVSSEDTEASSDDLVY
ncbi:hypothetical protein E1B28_004896 [Marasmius oreades]|uniref:Uncharacterized protein n=1 Tax=Marasmius oreades TaxID=181124 RepID=A0A9P8ADF9_9AGAR|nr:uncharacterized protein E1B28_004896 [Marasmius oreades]KAG7097559.1 hypothetical protein E1B28_004896 [Marasmius oreades]